MNKLNSPAALKSCFKPVTKFSLKSWGDESVLKNAFQHDMEAVDMIYDNSLPGIGKPFEADDYYVMLGASETFFERLRSSAWMSRLGALMGYTDYIHVQFFTQHPEISTKKVEHNAVMLPLSDFIASLPSLVLWMMC